MIQMVITIAIMMVVTGFAVVGISRARDHVRLMNSARQFAAYVERARGDAVRRHGQATVSVDDNNTYSLIMDWNGSGTTVTRSFDLEPGVVFTTGIKSITFDWRGRIPSEQSFGFNNGRNTVSVGVTGSGDVTFDAQFFHDGSLPGTTYSGPGGPVMPDPTPGPGGSGDPSASPSPSPSPTPAASPTPTPYPSPTPTATPNPSPTPSATPTSTPTPIPSPGASPSPSGSPNPGGSPAPCTLTVNPTSLTIVSDGSATVSVSRTNITGSGTITATSSNNGQIQVSPASASVSGTGAASFTVTIKKQDGSVTFSATSCGSKTVNITAN